MYQACRWYDEYPKLTFMLQMVKLMPQSLQSFVGYRLNEYLNHRQVPSTPQTWQKPNRGRWYDEVHLLVESLERLKEAPAPVKFQGIDYLLTLIEDTDTWTNCA